MRRVYFGVFGSGLGHVTRAIRMASILSDDGYEVRYSTSGQGAVHLEAKGLGGRVEKAPHLDVEWNPEGGFSSHRVLPQFPFTFNTFLRQVTFERNAMRRYDPRVVVSDSRLSPVFAAKSMGYPVVTMLNQFKILFPRRFRGKVGKLYERIAGDSLGLMWALSDEVLMTDLPPPYTIAEANIAGLEVSNIVKYVGFTTPDVNLREEDVGRVRASLGLGKRPLVFCPVSGPEPTKDRFVRTLIAAAREMSKSYDIVISMGYSKGTTEPKRFCDGGWLFEWCPVKDELLELSTLLVARAGHSTIGQCIDRSKPAVLVPIYNHPEQVANAEKFNSLGLGLEIKAEDLTPGALVEAVSTCVGDGGFAGRVEAVSKVSKRFNGTEKCVEIIESYAK
ncbi:MAG TPA: glycosyltransferase family protein [Nitrososphaerales archaeon]|nr:glycosyltransferase family protein [Nitrososphaerales archaeon]